MGKLLFSAIFFVLTNAVIFGQFTDKGYGDLKLGMTIKEAQKIFNFTLDQPSEDLNETSFSHIKINNTKIILGFIDLGENTLSLWSISTEDKNAKIQGFPSNNLIGKSLDEIKNLLGDKLQPVFGEESFYDDSLNESDYFDPYFKYIIDKAAKENEKTSCILFFNEEKILTEISATYNP